MTKWKWKKDGAAVQTYPNLVEKCTKHYFTEGINGLQFLQGCAVQSLS